MRYNIRPVAKPVRSDITSSGFSCAARFRTKQFHLEDYACAVSDTLVPKCQENVSDDQALFTGMGMLAIAKAYPRETP